MKERRFPKVAVSWAETPKSANFTSPPSVNRMFAPCNFKQEKMSLSLTATFPRPLFTYPREKDEEKVGKMWPKAINIEHQFDPKIPHPFIQFIAFVLFKKKKK